MPRWQDDAGRLVDLVAVHSRGEGHLDIGRVPGR